VESRNHYVSQVKRNQPTLFKEIERAIVEQKPLDYCEVEEKDHGRHSIWTTTVYDAKGSQKAKEWTGLRRFIHVHKCTIKKNKTGKKVFKDSNRFYITDLSTLDATYYQRGIRAHWKIENSLHWVKDVIHGEDGNGIRTHNGPVNSAVFSSIAINVHRIHGNQSITEGQIIFRKNMQELFDLIRT